ncbi:hypothetical protein BGZ60DRAFT_407681 [Tricladium varicosporioides]|nr:hypothetical protein BGZ60DRAFT_407681 [Hymenoscyphus varicosporioides]
MLHERAYKDCNFKKKPCSFVIQPSFRFAAYTQNNLATLQRYPIRHTARTSRIQYRGLPEKANKQWTLYTRRLNSLPCSVIVNACTEIHSWPGAFSSYLAIASRHSINVNILLPHQCNLPPYFLQHGPTHQPKLSPRGCIQQITVYQPGFYNRI